jgi:hypothetical protein
LPGYVAELREQGRASVLDPQSPPLVGQLLVQANQLRDAHACQRFDVAQVEDQLAVVGFLNEADQSLTDIFDGRPKKGVGVKAYNQLAAVLLDVNQGPGDFQFDGCPHHGVILL